MRVLAPCATALAAIAIALAGCGGGGPGSTSTSTAKSASPASAPRSAASAEQKPAPRPASPPSAPNPARQSAPEGAPTPGAKAVAPGVPVRKGGDNSIQAFGTEGAEAQRSQALADLRSYLGALGARQWARACALASDQLRRELGKLIAQAKVKGGGQKPKGCPGTLEALLGAYPATALRQLSAAGELLSFRVEDPYAYLIYRGEGGKPMFIAMAREEGKWRVNVPKPEAFIATTGRGSAR